jgi:hypothetical protein
MFCNTYSEGRKRTNTSSTVDRVQNMKNPPVTHFIKNKSGKMMALHTLRTRMEQEITCGVLVNRASADCIFTICTSTA